MFDLAPVSLWVEDYSGVKRLFAEWRAAGVTDLRAFLCEDLDRIRTCAGLIRIVEVNRKTLSLFEAEDQIRLIANLDVVFHDDMLVTHLDELVQLWNGQTEFSGLTVNYTLTGRRLDIRLNGAILPGYEDDWARVLVAIEDVTEREAARRALADSEAYARGLFQHSPVSLWVEDFSAVKHLLDDVRACGITDLRTFTDVHPEFVQRCMSEIRVIDVNACTLSLFGAADRADLLLHQHQIFRDAMQRPFREQLIDLWHGELLQHREVVNYSLAGDELHLLMQFSVLPGHERDWSLVQIALTDITARKKAEAYLEFLGKHDVLTKLYNRSFYVDEINRLERAGLSPTTVVIADLNGLKIANDRLGHAVGDQLLRRAGEILKAAAPEPAHAARIGGDEFAILLPGTDERGGQATIDDIQRLVEVNNQFYGGGTLSFALGMATSTPGERLEEVIKRADAMMYRAKRAYYAGRGGRE
ncbi:sensor domain-containing diguanylate cyclase [Siculibacillus lacustris]|nr:GGDEF domain-containing protein [Siculibacillus lacustris]